jgi:hypothetical protein
MKTLKYLWEKSIPNFLLEFIRFLLEPESYKIRRREVLEHYKKSGQTIFVQEIKEGLKYLKCHKFTPYPYNWTRKYDRLQPEVFRDEENKCLYTLFEGKRMYFPKSFNPTNVIWNTRTILKEQDPNSPHLYLNTGFQVEAGSIIIDAGVAEGNFALSVVEKAKRLYLVECDKTWTEALKLTFAPWKEKVVFIEKYLSDSKSETTVSIDSMLNPEKGDKYFIKLDIEGFEQKALSGMKRMAESANNIKMVVCTYHRLNDLTEIESTLLKYNFTCQFSDGYILYFVQGEEPSFRKALIRAEKR